MEEGSNSGLQTPCVWAFPKWVVLWAGPFPTSSFWSEILLLTPVAV